MERGMKVSYIRGVASGIIYRCSPQFAKTRLTLTGEDGERLYEPVSIEESESIERDLGAKKSKKSSRLTDSNASVSSASSNDVDPKERSKKK